MTRKIAISRLRILPVRKTGVSVTKKVTFLAELAGLGFRVTNPDAFDNSILDAYDEVIAVLKEMRGGNVNYVPLFSGFPTNTPDPGAYFYRRIIGFLGNLVDAFPDGKTLDNGVVVPEWLFNLDEFGADPITQTQDITLYKKGLKNQKARKGDTHTEWIDLTFVYEWDAEKMLQDYLRKNLYAKSSIKEALKNDLETLMLTFSPDEIDPKMVVFKETATYVMKVYWLLEDYDALRAYVHTPTDLLRMFAALTDTDVSLATSMKFPKLTRAQRKFVLDCLDKMKNPAADFKAYKGLWLKIGQILHPGEYKTRFPNAYAAFDLLRNGQIVTYDTEVEYAIMQRDLDALLPLLVQRPGVFARRIHHVLEISGKQYDRVLDAFATVSDKVPLKNLLVLDAYFRTIESSTYRTVINRKGKIRVMRNKQNRIKKGALNGVRTLISSSIISVIFAEKSSWAGKKVWVDQRLAGYTVPLQQRKASDGLMNIGRGSRIPLDESKVLRLFVYWKEAIMTTDLDLSIVQFDKNMTYIGHISYTNLSGEGMQHSGDIVSAPHGAAEFVDINIATLKKLKSCRYIATQVYRYGGDQFGEMDCHAGWMIRDKVDANYASFDIKTVQNKFDLNGSGAYSIPILVDLWTNEIVFIDLYMNGLTQHNRVESAVWDVSTVTREIARMIDTRPNMLDLATYHVAARGAMKAKSPDEADVTIGLADCDYNVSEIEAVLSELI